MDITLTAPIEQFLERQLEKGYASRDEVIRQAMLRWMDEENETPPRIREKLAEAASGSFKPGDRSQITAIAGSPLS